MVAAGVSDNATLKFVLRKAADLVVRSAQLEAADRLLIFCLEPDFGSVRGQRKAKRTHPGAIQPIQAGMYRNARNALMCIANIFQTDQSHSHDCPTQLVTVRRSAAPGP